MAWLAANNSRPKGRLFYFKKCKKNRKKGFTFDLLCFTIRSSSEGINNERDDIMNAKFNKIIEEKGFTKETLKEKILNRIENDGINLKEFNEEQQQKIIITYAATCLA